MKIRRIFSYVYTIFKLKFNRVKFNYKVLGNSFYIKNIGSITLSERVFLHSFPDGSCHKTALNTYYPAATIAIGSNCVLNGTVLHCNEKIIIGSKCIFGPGTIICDNNSHNVVIDYFERKKKPKSAPIIIEDNVWVGMNCLILKGVCIGENSIVAANSLVLSDVPKNSLVGGSPAKLIKLLE